MINFRLINLFSLLILVLTIPSISAWSKLPLENELVWWTFYSIIIIISIRARKIYFNFFAESNYFKIYMIWNIVCIARGIFIAENYWGYKNLINVGFVMLLPVCMNITVRKENLQQIFIIWTKYALPAFFLFRLFFEDGGDAIGRYLMPISLLLLFFPIFSNKGKIIILFFTLFVFFGGFGARSNVIKFSVPLVLSFIYYIRILNNKKIFEIARLVLMIIPIFFFSLGILGVFNIFKMDEYVSGDYTTKTIVNGQIEDENLTADTRTGLYVEELESAIKYNYVFFGRTPARGYESASFGYVYQQVMQSKNIDRFTCEVSILNIFNWTGVVGVLLYFLLFFRASYLAINKSQNIFMKIVGLYVAFRWAYAWVEDLTIFDLSSFFLFVSISMCFSNSFLNMTNEEMKNWVKGIFDKKYRDNLNLGFYQENDSINEENRYTSNLS